jgi:hypothetical protein
VQLKTRECCCKGIGQWNTKEMCNQATNKQ